jgi:hypothetical protein
MLIGYARVSTHDQDTAAQVVALKAAGCERMYREKASGGRWDRLELLRLMDHLRNGDVVVVWKLDRLSRYFIPDGVFESGRNPREAAVVVEAVLDHMRLHPDESLGVATLNFEQRELVQTNEVISTIQTPGNILLNLALTSDGRYLYASVISGTGPVIDTTTNSIIGHTQASGFIIAN